MEFRNLNMNDLEAIIALQNAVHDALDDREVLQTLTKEEFAEIIGKGISLVYSRATLSLLRAPCTFRLQRNWNIWRMMRASVIKAVSSIPKLPSLILLQGAGAFRPRWAGN